jgi:hypothetical protein
LTPNITIHLSSWFTVITPKFKQQHACNARICCCGTGLYIKLWCVRTAAPQMVVMWSLTSRILLLLLFTIELHAEITILQSNNSMQL